MITLEILEKAIKHAWCYHTAKGDWDRKCPSLNQCAVTALVVQDFLGGELLRCNMTDGDSHYWNITDDGYEIDFTQSQFKCIEPKPMKETAIRRARSYVLSFPDTMRRYRILRRRVDDYLFMEYGL